MVSDTDSASSYSDLQAKISDRLAKFLGLANGAPDGSAPRALTPSWSQRISTRLPWGGVSKTHLNEAKERYITLSRQVEKYKKFYQGNNGDEEKLRYLMTCDDILSNLHAHYLKRHEGSLNFAWRELVRVQITLIDHLLPPSRPELLAHQVDAAREEAWRLGVSEDPHVKEYLQQLAEALVVDDTINGTTRTYQVKRLLRALHERFNSIRSTRMHQQYVNIWSYKVSLLALVLISIVIMANANLILGSATKASGVPFPSGVEWASDWTAKGFIYSAYGTFVEFPLDFLVWLFDRNTLAFVYLAGLTGGFLSVANRVRGQVLTPGEDAYVGWYVLTKPLVGALGAMVVYILFISGFINLALDNQTAELAEAGMTNAEMAKNMAKTKVFGIAFISGFSERLVFPNFR